MSRAVGRRLLACALVAAGCAHPGAGLVGPPTLPECGGPLPPVAALGGDFRARVQVRATAPDAEQALDLVLEKHDGVLRVVALDALGSKRLAVTQRDDGTAPESDDFGRPAPIPPGTLLRDLHAARAALHGGPPAPGVEVAPGDPVSGAPPRVTVARPGCDHRARFVWLRETPW